MTEEKMREKDRERVSVGVWKEDHEILLGRSNPNLGKPLPAVIHEALVLAGWAPDGAPCPRCEAPIPRAKIAHLARCKKCGWPLDKVESKG